MYESNNPIDQLVHLYVDGAFDRRELVRRVAKLTGSMAAAMAALAGFPEEMSAQPTACPADVKTTADDPTLVVQDVEYSGVASRMFGHLAYPKDAAGPLPAIIVIHENRGLVEHIKDVTRRAAKAGFVALGVDLLSRQGGTGQFTEPAAQTAAYGRTTVDQRRDDLIASLDYLKFHPRVVWNRIGAVGFCAGGQNVWDFAVAVPELAAAVPFYGAPPVGDAFNSIQTPVLAIYAERDRALTQRALVATNEMITRQKVVGLRVYEGVGHAFHNDTGAAYQATAACDAWATAIAWFNKWLRQP